MKVLKVVTSILALTSISVFAQVRPVTELRPVSRINANKCAKLERDVFGGRALRGRALARAKKAHFNCVRQTRNAKAFEAAASSLPSRDKKILSALSEKSINSLDDVNKEDLKLIRSLSPKVTTLIKKWEKLTPNERGAYKNVLQSGRRHNWVAVAMVVLYAVEKGFEHAGNSYPNHLIYPEIDRARLLDF
ncbi:MAG: hypothetical protein CME68_05985 [Halobacteriovoraceae bacterium]|nr:hypothetical protein [Halobacteriovoraceae bacterium]